MSGELDNFDLGTKRIEPSDARARQARAGAQRLADDLAAYQANQAANAQPGANTEGRAAETDAS